MTNSHTISCHNNKWTLYDKNENVIIISENPKILSQLLNNRYNVKWQWSHRDVTTGKHVILRGTH